MTTRRLRVRRDRRRNGRPRKANARRRATTVAGRRAPDDLGTPELRRRKVRATTRLDLEVNAIGVLVGRGLIDLEQYDTLATVTMWLQRLARAWGGLGGCHGLWLSIIGAMVPTGFARPSDSTASGLADGARRQLARALHRLDGNRDLVIALAEGQAPPLVLRAIENRLSRADEAELVRLRRGLDHLAGRRSQDRAAVAR